MPYITKENAASLGARGGSASWAVRSKALDEQKQARAAAEKLEEFTVRTLARVRLQLDKVYCDFMRTTDPQKLDRLAAAQSRLAEQERILAGRPMPGSLKPSSKPARRSTPVEPEPDLAEPQADSRSAEADDPSAPNG